jgi:hypothetical protein
MTLLFDFHQTSNMGIKTIKIFVHPYLQLVEKKKIL